MIKCVSRYLKDPQIIWMLLILLALVCVIISSGGCAIFTQSPGSAVHEKKITELFDGTVITEERTEIIQPEGSKEATSYTVTSEPFTLTGVFGSQYDWESIKQKFSSMQPFIWSGIVVIVLSVFCTVKRWCSTTLGVAGIATGAGFSLFGALMPTYGGYVFWGLAFVGVGLFGYILWMHGK